MKLSNIQKRLDPNILEKGRNSFKRKCIYPFFWMFISIFLLFPFTRIMLRSFLSRIFLKKLESGKTFFWATKNKGDQHIVDVEWDRSNQKNQNEKELEE